MNGQHSTGHKGLLRDLTCGSLRGEMVKSRPQHVWLAMLVFQHGWIKDRGHSVMAGESQSGRLIRRSRVQVPPGSLKPPDKGGFFCWS